MRPSGELGLIISMILGCSIGFVCIGAQAYGATEVAATEVPDGAAGGGHAETDSLDGPVTWQSCDVDLEAVFAVLEKHTGATIRVAPEVRAMRFCGQIAGASWVDALTAFLRRFNTIVTTRRDTAKIDRVFVLGRAQPLSGNVPGADGPGRRPMREAPPRSASSPSRLLEDELDDAHNDSGSRFTPGVDGSASGPPPGAKPEVSSGLAGDDEDWVNPFSAGLAMPDANADAASRGPEYDDSRNQASNNGQGMAISQTAAEHDEVDLPGLPSGAVPPPSEAPLLDSADAGVRD